MIVTRDNFEGIVNKFMSAGERTVDVETTGLKWYDKSRLFSIIIADDEDSYYFNFNPAPDHLGNLPPAETVLGDSHKDELALAFNNPDSLWFAHNAKFDLGMLSKDGLCPAGKIHCTEVVARLLNSSFFNYTLADCVERMARQLKLQAVAKDDAVKKYVMQHKLYTEVIVPGKDKPILEMHYELVPFELIAPYGVTDGRITQALGRYQQEKVKAYAAKDPRFLALVENELGLIKVALKMAQVGVPYDSAYVKEAMAAELGKLALVESEYKGHTGTEFVDSGVQFAKYFQSQGIPFKRTEAGNPSFDESALESMPEHPVVDLILAHRSSKKKVGTYYSSFNYYGAGGRIHADMRQSGTATGRVSYREPNMQNVPKEEDPDQDWLVRACFVPPEGQAFFMPDFDQMEYRMMLDEAEEMGVIRLIIDNGLDVHEATAQMMGVTRREAKTINFLLLYGGGDQKLANALGIPLMEAKALKQQYFMKLPNVKQWIFRTIKQTQMNGFVKNWMGRICVLPRQQAYKAPNYKIQGGCADVVKIAMNQIGDLLEGRQTNMALQVHDELLFTMPREELDLQSKIVQIMEKVYPYKHLPLTAGPGHSWTNWAEKKDGFAV